MGDVQSIQVVGQIKKTLVAWIIKQGITKSIEAIEAIIMTHALNLLRRYGH